MIVENLEFHIKHTGDKGASGLKNLRNSLKGARKEAEKSQGIFGKLLNTFKRLTMLRVLRRIIQEIGKGFEEGLKNAYAFSKTINGELSKTLNSIASLGMQMKNQLGSALGELLINVRPIVEAIENLIIRIADAMSRLFAVLGGRSTYNKAIASTEEWASATESGAAAAKEWKKQLLGFDEINKLEAPMDSGSGGGSSDNIGKWEEAVAQMEWAKQLRDITLSWFNNLNLEPLINAWTRLKTAVKGFVDIVDGALYWAYTNVLLPLAGWTIEKGLPATLLAVAAAFELINVVLKKLEPLFKDLFEVVLKPFAEWVGEKFIDAMNGITETLTSLKEKVEQANSLGEFVDSLNGKEKVLVAIAVAITAIAVASALLGVAKTVFTGLSDALGLLLSPVGKVALAIGLLTLAGMELYQKFDTVKEKFDEVGEKFSEFKERFKEPEYWTELGTVIVEALATAVGAAIGSLATGLVDLAGELVQKLREAIATKFGEDLNGDGKVTWGDIGGNIFIGILEGVANAVKGIADWIKTHILDPFVKGFKEAFGIHSPAETMKPLGEAIWEGILEGILDIIKDVAEWIKTKVWEPLKSAIKSAFGINEEGGIATKVKTFGESLADGLKNGVEKVWAGIGVWFNDTVWVPLETEFSSLYQRAQGWVASLQSAWSTFSSTMDRFSQANIDAEGLYAVYPGQYKADGGYVDSGELFVAREAGAELVGSVGGRTAVMNNDQIVAAVSTGVANAVASVMRSGRNSNGEVVINVNGKEFVRAIYNDMKTVQSEKGFSLVNA